MISGVLLLAMAGVFAAGAADTNISLKLSGPDCLHIGTNSFLMDADGLSEQKLADACASHVGEGHLWTREELLSQAARLSRPLQTVEEETISAGSDSSGDAHLPSVRISTAFLDRLNLNPLKHGPVARSKLEMDLESGGIGLQAVEMGFDDRRLWLIHTPSTDETEGSMGVELKLRW
ncbi:MAG: hypothetical protein AB7T27_05690 [Kiritimatiellia bacterium]